MKICPVCKGIGFLEGFGCPGFKLIKIDCILCKGAKEISDEQMQWVEHGNKIREARVKMMRVMREEARIRGMKPSEWSDIEQGRVYNLDVEIP